MYLIYSHEHQGRLWRPNSNGYTRHFPDAGLYRTDHAKEIIEQAAIGWRHEFEPCPPEIAIPPRWIIPGDLGATLERVLFAAGWWRSVLTAARRPDGTYLTPDDVWTELWEMPIDDLPRSPDWSMMPEPRDAGLPW